MLHYFVIVWFIFYENCVYTSIYWSLVVHYSLDFTVYKAASGGFLFDVGLLGPCRSMPRSAKDLAKHANDLAKHAKVSRGRCQASLGVVKQAYTSYVPTIYWSLVVHYSLSFIAYKAASGEVSFRCETPRTLQKHANVGQGPCKACRGRCKTCRDRPRTLLSMRRSCKASLHILDSHSFKLRFFVK